MAIRLTTSYQRISTIGLSYGEIRTYAKYSNQSIADNKTTYELKSTYYTSQNTLSFSSATGNLDGTTRSYGYTTMYKGETTISEVSRTITHNTDGSSPIKNVATSWTATFGGSGSTSADIDFPKINRYATLTSAPDFNDEASPKITFTKNIMSSSAVVEACMKLNPNDATPIIPYRQVDVSSGSYTFNLTTAERNALRNQIPNSNTLNIYYLLRTTYQGNSYFSISGVKTVTIVNATPTISSITTTEQNTKVSALLGTSANTIVQNASNVKVDVSASATKGASLTKVELTHSGTTYSDTTSPYSFTVPVKANSFTIKATGSRPNPNTTTSQTITRTMIDYKPVAINSFSFKRQTETSSTIILNLSATYYQQTFGSTANAPIVKWKKDDGSWTTLTSSQYTIDNTNHKLTVSNLSLGEQVDYEHEATFTIYIEDKLSTAQNSAKVTIGIPTLELGKDDVKVNGTFVATGDITSSTNVNCNLVSATGRVESPVVRSKLETLNGRINNANIAHTYENNRAHLQLLLASSTMTSNKPKSDGYILHCSWDNSGQYNGQLFLPNNSTSPVQFRGCSNGTWGAWWNIEQSKLLWTNTNTSEAWASARQITLNASDYDMYEVIYFYGATNSTTNVKSTGKIPKGKTTQLEFLYNTSGANAVIRRREFTYNSDTKYTVGKNTGADGDYACRPLYVIGYKTGLF